MGKPFKLFGLFPHQKYEDVRPVQAWLQGYCEGHGGAHTTEKVPADRTLATGASLCPSHSLTAKTTKWKLRITASHTQNRKSTGGVGDSGKEREVRDAVALSHNRLYARVIWKFSLSLSALAPDSECGGRMHGRQDLGQLPGGDLLHFEIFAGQNHSPISHHTHFC